jgi:uncharacterized membrane protein YbhN (UPF0104 family)
VSGTSSPRTALLLAAKVAVSVVLYAWLFRRVDWAAIGPALGHATPFWILAAAGLLFASHLLASYQWGRLLRAAGIELPFWKVVSYYHVGLFFNNFLPANVGGDLARTLDASRSGSSRATALSTVILDRLLGTVALGAIAVITTLPALGHFHLLVPYLGVLTFFAMAMVMLRAVLEPRVLAVLEKVLSRVGLGRLSPALDELSGSLAAFRGQRPLLLELFAVALGVQVVPLLAVIVSLPISLNGIGVREGAGILLFGLVGLDRSNAFALQFGTYLVAVGVSMLGGLVFLMRIPGRRARARNPRRSTE